MGTLKKVINFFLKKENSPYYFILKFWKTFSQTYLQTCMIFKVIRITVILLFWQYYYWKWNFQDINNVWRNLLALLANDIAICDFNKLLNIK